MTVGLDRMIAVRLVARAPDRLARFYAEALGAEVAAAIPIPEAEVALVGAGERRTLHLGAERLDLDAFAEPGAPYPPGVAADDLRFQHVAVIVADVAAACAEALRCGAKPISSGGPVRLPAASGGATAVKLRDPEGHPFELIALASPSRWDGVAPNGRGVRGIDHSAIAVRDAAASRRFYAERGLVERGATFNHGPEQAALDGLRAPEVDVAPLYPAGGTPHLELLGYRFAPSAAAVVGERDTAATRLVWSDAQASGFMLLRDPDGHRHLVQPS